jgi:hypothetical protein
MASDVAEPRYGEKAQDAGQHFKPVVLEDRTMQRAWQLPSRRDWLRRKEGCRIGALDMWNGLSIVPLAAETSTPHVREHYG